MPYSPLELANAFIQAGELDDALDALNQHLDAHPADDDTRRLRCQVLLRLRGGENLGTALHDLRSLSSPTLEDRLMGVILLEQLGDFGAALDAAAELHNQHPADEAIAERFFWLLMRQRRCDEAARLLAIMPRTSGWLTKAGDLALEHGQQDHALAHYTEALRLLESEFDLTHDAFARPIQANLLVSRAQAYANLRRFNEADADYAAAAALMPDDLLIPFWHSFVLLEVGQTERALALCRAALAGANATLRAIMIDNLNILSANPPYTPLAALLNGQ